jgi:hypothetical protein
MSLLEAMPVAARRHLTDVVKRLPNQGIGPRTRGLSPWSSGFVAGYDIGVLPPPCRRPPHSALIRPHFGYDVGAVRPLPRQGGHGLLPDGSLAFLERVDFHLHVCHATELQFQLSSVGACHFLDFRQPALNIIDASKFPASRTAGASSLPRH